MAKPTDSPPGVHEDRLDAGREDGPLRERLQAIVDRMLREAKPGGRDLTKDEIDRMWGHE